MRAIFCCPASSPSKPRRQYEAAREDARHFRQEGSHRKGRRRRSSPSFSPPSRSKFSRKAGDEDHLFGSVTSGDIAEALEAKGFKIDKKKIVLAEPIKALGEFEVPVKLHREVTAPGEGHRQKRRVSSPLPRGSQFCAWAVPLFFYSQHFDSLSTDCVHSALDR